MPQRQFYALREFGGLFNGRPELAQPEFAARIALNTRYEPNGIRPQYGFERLVPGKIEDGGTARYITTTYDYQDGVDQHALAVAGNDLWELSDWPGNPLTNSWVNVYGALAKDEVTGQAYRMDFETAFGRCFFQNGYMDGLVYDGPNSTLPGSPQVFYWGVDEPEDAVTHEGTSGEIEGGVGSFENFTDLTYFFGTTPVEDWAGTKPVWHNMPDGWGNPRRMKVQKSTDAFTGDASVELWAGREDGADFGSGQGAGGIPFNSSDSIVTTTPHPVSPVPTGPNKLYLRCAGTDWPEIKDWLTGWYLGDGDASVKVDSVVYDIDSIVPYEYDHGILGKSQGITMELSAPPTAVPYPGTTNFRFYRGPRDAVLQRQIETSEADWNTAGDISVSLQVKRIGQGTDYADVRIRIRETYVDVADATQAASTTTTVNGLTTEDKWNQAIVQHTLVGHGGTNKGVSSVKIQMYVDNDGALSPDTSPREFSARFDEIRIVKGTTAPVSGGDLKGIYKYYAVFVDEEDGTYSGASPVSDSIDVNGGFVTVNDIPQPNVTLPNHPVTHIYIYRSRSEDGQIYGPAYKVGQVEVGITTLIDDMPDAIAIEQDIMIRDVIHPPRGEYCLMYEGKMVVAGFYNDTYPFSTGTVTTVNGSDTVNGVGTGWHDGMAGLDFSIDGEDALYRVQAVVSATQLTLTHDYEETGGAGQNYRIGKDVRHKDGRTLYYSEVDQPGVFRDTNFLTLDTRDNDQITGIGINGGRLWAFTRDTVYEIVSLGDSFERVSVRHNGLGAETGYSINQYEGMLFFPARDGFYAMDQSGSEKNITRDIQLAWDRFVDFASFQQAAVQQQKVWLNGFTFAWCLDMTEGFKWSTFFSGHNWVTVGTADNSSDRELLLADDSGYLYRMSDDYTRQGVNTGTVGGIADSGTENTMTDGGASFKTAGDGLEYTYLRLRRLDAQGVTESNESYRIASNTGTVITIVGFWNDISGEDEGTVTVVNGSPIVAGVGSAWTAAMVGSPFVVDGDTVAYTVQSVDSRTQITLTANYAGAGGAGQDYSFPTPPDSNDPYLIGIIGWQWQSKWLDMGSPEIKKVVHRIRASMEKPIGSGDAVVTFTVTKQYGRQLQRVFNIEETEELSKWIRSRMTGYLVSFGVNGHTPDTKPVVKFIEAELSSWSNRGGGG